MATNENIQDNISVFSDTLAESSPQDTAISPRVAPSTPTNLTAQPVGYDSVELAWDTMPNADNYSIYRSLTADGNYTSIGNTTTTSYLNTGLNQNTTYYYKVSASTAGDESPLSEYITATTARIIPPANLQATAQNSSVIQLTWSPTQDASAYLVYRSLTPDENLELIGTPTTNAYTDTGLSANTTYYYSVRSRVGSQNSDYSNTASATTLQAAPEPPNNFVATPVSSTTIELKWTAPDVAVDGYRLYRSLSPNGEWALISTTTNTDYTDTGLDPNTRYYYMLESYIADQNSVGVRTDATTLIVPPVTYRCVKLWWCPECADYYEIMRRPSNQTTYARTGCSCQNYYCDCGIRTDTSYDYLIYAYICGNKIPIAKLHID